MEDNYIELVTNAVKNNVSDDEYLKIVTDYKNKLKKELFNLKIDGIDNNIFDLLSDYCVDNNFDDEKMSYLIDAKFYDRIERLREERKKPN